MMGYMRPTFAQGRKTAISRLLELLRQDNASYHKKQETYDWFKANRRYVEVFQLPPYWPELNATERIWNYTRKYVTYNRFFERPQDLVTRSSAGSITCDTIRRRSKT
jgi:transposase